jgi:hypothetical protein
MISALKFRKLIDHTEKTYAKCWKFLSDWKEGRWIFSADELLSFQPTLAEALFHLSETYTALSQERRSVISRKKLLSPKWFNQRMKRLSRYQDAITELVNIGRILGDSFVWIFYRTERKHLRKHFAHQQIRQVPTGVGGRGELAFISEVRTWHGQFTIYHGITSFLRIGDVSFYDPHSKKITAIGEIKTESDSGSAVELQLYLLWPATSKKVWRQLSKPVKKVERPLPFKRQQQLTKQLETMADSLNPSKVERVITLRNKTHLNEFRQLANRLGQRTQRVEQAGDGLLLCGFRSNREKSLFSRLLPIATVKIDKRLEGIETHWLKIVDMSQAGTSYDTNCTFIGSLDLGAYPGTTPMFWWPVPLEFVRKLAFHEVTVVTVYNPAHLIRKLRMLGFDVRLNGIQLSLTKRVGKVQAEMGDMHHFLHYIQQHLVREDFVLEIFRKILRRIESGEIPSNTLIKFDTQLLY